MNKWYVVASVLGLSLFFGASFEASAQHKGISFQAVMKKSDGSYPTASGVTVIAQILDPVNHCVLREEEHTGKNISNGYLNLVLGDSGAATPGTRNPSPVLSISQVLDNKTTRTGLKCVDQANNIVGTGQSYIPSNIDRRVLRVRLNLQGEDIAADFNMRAVGFAVNSELLNSKSDDDFVNINNAKGVTKINVESIFDRFTKLDAILNNFNSGGTSAGINISGNASTATTAASVSGTVGIANGGTGATTDAGARTNLGLGSLATMSPTGTADNTTYLRGDGTWASVSAGGAVTSVAGRTGAVTLSHSDVSGLGSLATKATSGTADNTTYLRGDGAWTNLGGAASLNVGVSAGTVAAGDDSRITGAVQNSGTDTASNVVSISAGLDSNKPGSPVAGQMYVATDLQKIYRYDGSSWITVAEVGGSGFSGSLAGDVSGPQGTTVVDKIKGQAVTTTANVAGQVLRYAGGNNWTPGFVAMTDLRSTVTGANSFASSCANNQTLVYNSVGDVMSCQNISITKSQISDFPALATVATSGSYNDLSDKPTIPAAQVNSDWSAVSGAAQILNKPTLGTLAGLNAVDLSGSQATGILNAARLPALSGDVTSTSGTAATTIANNAVTNAKFRQGAARSVVGVTGNATANVADIQGTANQVLRVDSGGTALAFGAVNLASNSAVTGTLPVANGGTGAASLTANNVILGNGTSPVQVVAPGTSGNVLTSNGTTWSSQPPAAGGGRTSCPAGFTLIGTSGSAEAFCISTNEEASATWLNATTACYNKTPTKARLCSASEWAMACVSGLPTNMTGNWEWVADLYTINGQIMGYSGCDSFSNNTVSFNYGSRCCFR